MKNIVKRVKRTPILFNYLDYTHEVDINLRDFVENSSIYWRHTSLSEFIDSLSLEYIGNVKTKFKFRDFSWYAYPGFIYYYNYDADSIVPITVVFEEDGVKKAWHSSDYLYFNPSRRTLLNKYAKFYGVEKNSDITLAGIKTIEDAFSFIVKLSMNDYANQEQQRIFNLYLENELKSLEIGGVELEENVLEVDFEDLNF